MRISEFVKLPLFIFLIGWGVAVIYFSVLFEFGEGAMFIKHFLSIENSGVKFRALIFFAPFITTVIAFLINEREKFLKKTLASQMEISKKNEELLAYNERLSALRSIEMAISSSIDLQATLKMLVEKVASQLRADSAGVLLYNPDTRVLVFSAGTGFNTDNIVRTSYKSGEGLAGRTVAGLGKTVIQDLLNIAEKGGHDAVRKFRESSLCIEEGFRSYVGVPLIAHGSVKGVMEIFNRDTFKPPDEWLEFLDAFADQAAIAIEKAALFNDLQSSNIELRTAYDTTIEGWARALDYRDKETEGHSRRVTEMTVQIARAMGMGEEDLVHVRRGALLHDIGKMGIPDRILLKPGRLDEEERGIIERHPEIAFNLISPIPFLKPAIDIPYCHHEMWDGTGYPRKLKGEEIPLSARIFAIVDVWDALCSDRPYRKAWHREKVLEHVHSLAGKHFDPKVAEVFIREIGDKLVHAPAADD
jgi:putative nucleotidyltransferase with HDIG domain